MIRKKSDGMTASIINDIRRVGGAMLAADGGDAFSTGERDGHALFRIPDVTLPRVVLASLHRSAMPLQQVVELRKDAVILAGAPKLMRGEVKRGGTNLLLRIERELLPNRSGDLPR